MKISKVTDYAALKSNIISHGDIISECTQVFLEIFKLYFAAFVCLFVLFDSLRPINNLSVKQGRVFLG